MDGLREYFLLNNKPNLTIVVNLSVENLKKAADWTKSQYSVQGISINQELSKLLVGIPKANLSKEIIDWISEKIKKIFEEPILLTDIDILFEPSFQLDPLAIFRQATRNKILVVFWPGEYKNKNLTYASPDHAHYKTWADPGVEILKV